MVVRRRRKENSMHECVCAREQVLARLECCVTRMFDL